MRRAMIVWLAVPLAAAIPASAQTYYEDWEAAPWQVYQEDDSCWLAYTPAKGHAVVVSVSEDRYDFYVGVVRSDWTWVVDKGRYSIRVRFGKFDELEFGQGNDGPGVAVSYPAFRSRGLKAILSARTLTIGVQAKYQDKIDLDPTALREFGICANGIKAYEG